MSQIIEVRVPDIGDFKDVPVIEIAVAAGQRVACDDALVTLESDKATLDVPAPAAGVVSELKVKLGDRLAEGSLILLLQTEASKTEKPAAVAVAPVSTAQPAPAAAPQPMATTVAPALAVETAPAGKAHASPSVRRFARDLGVDVTRVPGSGPKGRILHQDVQAYVKGAMAGGGAAGGGVSGGAAFDLLPWPKVDFAKYGPVETRPLSRIQKISAANLARNWVMVPAVSYREDADITELEAFRLKVNEENAGSGVPKLTLLAFLIKAVVAALKRFPDFNSSLDGDTLVLKQYFHVAFAADTPAGLVVPVIRDADCKGIFELAAEAAALAKKAREGRLMPGEMAGACITISSLGGIGGTGFAPIVNAPEVAIVGANKSAIKPVWDGATFVPRLILPLSLSADHRVIDGVAATRFNLFLAQALADMRRVLL